MKPVKPMEPVSKKILPMATKYIYQVKWDGIRIIAYLNYNSNGNLQLFTKRGNPRLTSYPELEVLRKITRKKTCILDGEVIVTDERGRPDFYRVLKRDRVKKPDRHLLKTHPVTYLVFDLLLLEENWLLTTPLIKRQELLENFLAPEESIKIPDNYNNSTQLLETTKKFGLEGVVAKEKEGLYYPGKKHPTWIKVKNYHSARAQVIGLILKGNNPRSLVLGHKEDNNSFSYIGRVSSGITEQDLWKIYQTFDQVMNKTPNYVIQGKIPLEQNESVIFIPPVLTVEVRYLEFTPDKTLRNPVIIGFVKD